MGKKEQDRQRSFVARGQEFYTHYAAKKTERKERLELTLLYTGVFFVHILLTVLIAGLALYALIRLGVLGSQLSEVSVILFFGLASLLVGTIMTLSISKLLLRPINALINRMNRLAAGDYRVRILPGKFISRHAAGREFSDSFNRMAQELESTEMLRGDFVNNFSHEFKTPIVSIAGFAKLLKAGGLSEEQRTEYLNIIEMESLRLSQMATNVLELTKVENQTVLTDLSDYNISEQIRSCILLLNSKWEQKELEFELDLAEHTVVANEELLRQVWINLLDNAIKFSPPGGSIGVTIGQTANRISVSVVNTGPDIPPDKQGKIFNKFYQADESHASPGNGVGLAIVKQVVTLHHGFVEVKSEGGVTMFTVTLPQ